MTEPEKMNTQSAPENETGRRPVAPRRVPHTVKLLVGVIRKEDEAKYTAAVNECCAALNISGPGYGTASSNYLSYLGFNEIEKRVILSLIPDTAEQSVLQTVSRSLKLYMSGMGIAFTMPLTAISGVIHTAILAGAETPSEKKPTRRKDTIMHELVIVVVDQKFTDAAIDAARSAGATGATVFHTRTVDNAKIEQRIGTAFRRETNAVFLLTTQAFSEKIMNAVRDVAGLKTEGGAVIFSLPVDELVGIGRFEEEEEERTI